MAKVGSVEYEVKLDNKGIDQEINGTESKISTKLGKAFGKTASVVGAAATTAVAAGAAAVTSIVKNSVEAYGEYEQLVGGIETLYKDSADQMISYADEAWKSAGLSANDYMSTAIESSAAMINSLDGDTAKAAEMTNMAIIDMADNVNKMGTDMEAVQNAYRGFSRGNFTMLDNLALGFAGTKEGMQSLLDKAQEISGVKYDISSYSDIVEAIHVVQTEMGITGTTAKEASSTIQGSLGAMKSAWSNLATGMADPNADIGKLIGNMVDSAKTFLGNLIPVIKQSMSGITGAIKELAPVIAKELPGIISEALPELLETGATVVETLLTGIMDALPTMLPTVIDLVVSLAGMILDMAPELVQTGLELIVQLATGIAKALPELIPAIVSCILQIVKVLTDPTNVKMITQAAIKLILALARGILDALPELISAIPEIISNLVEALTDPDMLTMLIKGAIDLVVGIVTHLPEIILALIQAIPSIIWSICQAFLPISDELGEVFAQAWEAVKNIFANVGEWFGNKFAEAKEKAGNAWDKIKDHMQKNREANEKIWHNIGDWFGNKFRDAKDRAVNAWSNIRDKFSGIWDKIRSAFRFSDALQWGRDMIQNFVNGIWGMIDRVREAVGNVADTVRSFLGFSEPEKGPLSNFHTFAPDMMDLFATGIDDNIGEVEDSVEDVSRVLAGGFMADVNYNLPDLQRYAQDLGASVTAMGTAQITVPISIDGREVARATAWYTNEQLAWEAR